MFFVISGASTVTRRVINLFPVIYYVKGQVASILDQIQFVNTLLSSDIVLLQKALGYKVNSSQLYSNCLEHHFFNQTVKSELPSSLLLTDFFELLASSLSRVIDFILLFNDQFSDFRWHALF